MADTKDPYYEWLGIPPKDQPPNHYRLLGLEVFEDNRNVIATAADRQMGFIKNYQTGPPETAELSQRILNELMAARICLLKPEKKEGYDRELRSKLKKKEADVAASESERSSSDGPLVGKGVIGSQRAKRSPRRVPMAVPAPVAQVRAPTAEATRQLAEASSTPARAAGSTPGTPATSLTPTVARPVAIASADVGSSESWFVRIAVGVGMVCVLSAIVLVALLRSLLQPEVTPNQQGIELAESPLLSAERSTESAARKSDQSEIVSHHGSVSSRQDIGGDAATAVGSTERREEPSLSAPDIPSAASTRDQNLPEIDSEDAEGTSPFEEVDEVPDFETATLPDGGDGGMIERTGYEGSIGVDDAAGGSSEYAGPLDSPPGMLPPVSNDEMVPRADAGTADAPPPVELSDSPAEGSRPPSDDILLAQQHVSHGEFDEARKAFLRASRNPHEEARASFYLGLMAALHEHEAADARKYFSRCLRCGSAEIACLNNLGLVHLRRKDLTAATQAWKDALDIGLSLELEQNIGVLIMMAERQRAPVHPTVLRTLKDQLDQAGGSPKQLSGWAYMDYPSVAGQPNAWHWPNLVDRVCMQCNGRRYAICTSPGCLAGKVRVKRTQVLSTPDRGNVGTRATQVRVDCRVCSGSGRVTCPCCRGSGIDKAF